MKKSTSGGRPAARTKLAKKAGVGEQAIQRATFVAKVAPDLNEKVKHGLVSQNEAHEQAKAIDPTQKSLSPGGASLDMTKHLPWHDWFSTLYQTNGEASHEI